MTIQEMTDALSAHDFAAAERIKAEYASVYAILESDEPEELEGWHFPSERLYEELRDALHLPHYSISRHEETVTEEMACALARLAGHHAVRACEYRLPLNIVRERANADIERAAPDANERLHALLVEAYMEAYITLNH